MVTKLLLEGALIEVDCIAVLGGKKETHDFDSSLFPRTVCSPIVKKGNLIFISGLAGINVETNQLVGDDVVTQMSQIFMSADKMLNAAGVGWKDVLKTVDFIAPEGRINYRDTANVRRQYFGETLPASTGVFMNQLLRAGFLIQVDFVAVAD
ncbi:RidA family protein [Chloroflexota bacterium]